MQSMYEQSAVFIDAGFLLAVGSTETTGTSLRSSTVVDVRRLIRGIVERTWEDSGLSPLRVYWYDASRNGIMADEHKKIALIDDVKVRLGRIGINGAQKGVDLRLGLDMVEVARTRSARVAYLLCGDDDIAEAVEAAQDQGMKVVLMGLEDPHRRVGLASVAEHLALQVDRILPIPADLIRACFEPSMSHRSKESADGISAVAAASLLQSRSQEAAEVPVEERTGTSGAEAAAGVDAEAAAGGDAALGLAETGRAEEAPCGAGHIEAELHRAQSDAARTRRHERADPEHHAHAKSPAQAPAEGLGAEHPAAPRPKPGPARPVTPHSEATASGSAASEPTASGTTASDSAPSGTAPEAERTVTPGPLRGRQTPPASGQTPTAQTPAGTATSEQVPAAASGTPASPASAGTTPTPADCVRTAAEAPSQGAPSPATAPPGTPAPRTVPAGTPRVPAAPLYSTSSQSAGEDTETIFDIVEGVAEKTARSWLASVTQIQLEEVLGDYPYLEPDLDRALLQDCAARIGEFETNSQTIRKHLRNCFWAAVRDR